MTAQQIISGADSILRTILTGIKDLVATVLQQSGWKKWSVCILANLLAAVLLCLGKVSGDQWVTITITIDPAFFAIQLGADIYARKATEPPAE